jgi:DNA polymerase-3 subunit epsilon
MLIAGLDLETTGLDTGTCGITEISAALWDTNGGRLLSMFTTYVQPCQEIPAEVQKLNGITNEDCDRFGVSISLALTEVYARILRHAHLGVAHNWTDFDGPILKRLWSEHAKRLVCPDIQPIHWVDSSVDVPYPEHVTTRKLEYLCASHGFLNPFPHRSLFDVVSMLKVVSHYPVDKILELVQSPMIRIRAVVSFEDREKAKARGYRWGQLTKTWTKNIRQSHLDRERADAGFPIEVLA